MDFTIKTYKSLLKSLQNAGFSFITFADYLNGELPDKFVILRHDVDDKNQNSLAFAHIQAEMGIKGSYYFRMVPQSFDKNIIKEIHSLGHEIGYHYEDMDFANGDRKKAIEYFEKHLKQLREVAPIETICMHGSPRSTYDNKDVWKDYDYKSYGILGEPYFDVDFDKLFYITDTGRMWDGFKVSVRDKVPQQELWNKQGLTFHSTQDIIRKVKSEKRKVKREEKSERLNLEPVNLNFPNQVMFTFHPQRWHDSLMPWTKEFVMQNAKNVVKRWFFVR